MKTNYKLFSILLIFNLLSCAHSGKSPADNLAESVIGDKSSSKQAPSSTKKIPLTKKTLVTCVLKDDRWKYITLDHDDIGINDYSYADVHSDGWACVNKQGQRMMGQIIGGEYYFINKEGKRSEIGFDEAARFDEGRAIINFNGYKAVVDTNMNVLAKDYNFIYTYSEGLAGFKKNGKTGFLNLKGELEIELPEGYRIDRFTDGLARCQKEDKAKIGFLDRTGAWAIEPQFTNVRAFSDGMAMVKENGKYGFIDTDGNLVIPTIYDNAANYNEGVANVYKDGKWGFIDKQWNTVIEHQFDQCGPFSEGLAVVAIDGEVGYIDSSGNYAFKMAHVYGSDFHNGFALVSDAKKVGYINKKGETVIPLIYDRGNYFQYVYESNKLFRAN